jgi:hypothetical protein
LTANIDINQLQVPYGRNAILARYEKYGREREETVHEMVFNRHFKPLAIAQQKSKPRPVTMEVKQITRVKHKGKGFLKYGATLKSSDYRTNAIDFYETFGHYELPKFAVQTDPNTEEIIEGSAQVNGWESVYDIPFTKEKAKELLAMAPENGSIGLAIVDSNGKRYSCSQNEFLNDSYDELIDRKTGFSDYLRDKDRRNNSS